MAASFGLFPANFTFSGALALKCTVSIETGQPCIVVSVEVRCGPVVKCQQWYCATLYCSVSSGRVQPCSVVSVVAQGSPVA